VTHPSPSAALVHTSFALTIDFGNSEHGTITTMTGKSENATLTCETTDDGGIPAFPITQTIYIGPDRNLADEFKKMTGKDLPEGCRLPVPSIGVLEAVKPFTKGVTVFVDDSLPRPSPKPEGSSEPGWGEVFETFLIFTGGYFAPLAVGFVVVGTCIGVGAYKARYAPGGGLDRERAPDLELQPLDTQNQQDTDSDPESDDGGPAREQAIDNGHQQRDVEGDISSTESYGPWEDVSTRPTEISLQPKATEATQPSDS
jgi:hypothetical protein